MIDLSFLKGGLSYPKLGTDIFTGDEVLFTPFIRDEKIVGVNIICGLTGFGKTIQMRNIYCQYAKFKRIIVFDAHVGEHTSSRFPNINSEIPTGVPNLHIVRPAFFISDFDKIADWVSLGFPDSASRLMVMLSQKVNHHNNEPNDMLRLLEELPTATKDFDDKWKEIGLRSPCNSEAKKSAVNRFYFLLENNYFISEGNKVCMVSRF